MRKMRFVGARLVCFGIVAAGVVGLLVVGLWNVLMPAIFGLPAISFWQALGLFLLSRILFGRFGGWGDKMHKARFIRGWNDLAPDERERFRHALGLGHRDNFGEPDAADKA